MQYFFCIVLLCLMLAACGENGRQRSEVQTFDVEESEMGEKIFTHVTDTLYVPSASVRDERAVFGKELQKVGRGHKNRRALYERYISVIGANGILETIEELWPKCHSEAHALGAVIQKQVKDIGLGLRVCRDGCYSGCMHGVLMEAFSVARNPEDPEGHVDLTLVRPMMNELCTTNEIMITSYSPGDCAHGVGHAMMFLANYDVPAAITLCDEFDQVKMDYYCATGAYMEYMGEKEKQDAKEHSLLYPCDTEKYPAACARYKMVYVLRRHLQEKRPLTELVKVCETLEGKFRLGCFHGLGNGAMGRIRAGQLRITDVCLHGTEQDQFACIDGAMERMAKYHGKRAREVCEQLAGQNHEICLQAVSRMLYDMEKNLTLYLAD